MLTIREDQLKALSRVDLDKFEEKLIEHAQEFFPMEYKNFGREKLKKVAGNALSKCELYGYTSQKHAMYFFSLMLLLGSQFDSDVQLPWAYDYLTNESIVDLDERIENTWNAASNYLSNTAGENLENLISALNKLRKLELNDAPSSTGEKFEGDLRKKLREIYPNKYNTQSEPANNALIKYGIHVSKSHEFNSPQGKSIIILLMFFFGSDFLSDPIYTWLVEIVKDPNLKTEDERINTIIASSRKYLSLVLTQGVSLYEQ